jgi:L-alanine-DL-glutamate epimerase-like enolase superfamily enzyme
MKIARVTATPLNVPIKIDVLGLNRTTSLSACLAEIESDEGLIGHGFTAITEEEVIARIIEGVAGPAIIGDDPMAHEAIWDKLYWTLMPRGQTGYAAHALAALDVALWDLKGKALKQPIWRLLGGARSRVPVYATFGFGFFDRAQLADAAKLWVSQGFKRLKMTVGMEALRKRDQRPLLEAICDDEARIRSVREAVGAEIELFIDANCSLDYHHAARLCAMATPYRISFFEEPLTQNDVLQMAALRRQTGMALACGQNEGLLFRFRDLLVNQAIDYAQPNVTITGGFTQCLKVAGLAAAFNVPIANGGAWPFHNMHLQAGVANGSLVELHYLAVELCKQIYKGLPSARDGFLDLPDAPGLGFELDRDAVRELAKLPLSQGRGKG